MPVKIPTVRRTDSLYAKIGGQGSLEAIVEELYSRAQSDPMLISSFTGVNAESLRGEQVKFLAELLGGPQGYAGEPGGPIHASVPAEDAAYERVAKHLAAA